MSTKVDLTGVRRTFYGTPPPARWANRPGKSNRQTSNQNQDQNQRQRTGVSAPHVLRKESRFLTGLGARFGMTTAIQDHGHDQVV
jgi:hypothetical protein